MRWFISKVHFVVFTVLTGSSAGGASAQQDGKAPEEARKLLQDPKAGLRFKAALALTKERQVEAIPVLIDLLAEVAAPQRQMIEEALQDLAGEWAPTITLSGDDDIARRIRRDAWMGWWKRTDGPALLVEFRKHTPSEKVLARIQELIAKLGDKTAAVREQAVADLVGIGPLAVALLREAASGAHRERAAAAERCLQALDREQRRSLPSASARLLALRKPPGAIEVLLDFLPWNADEALGDEIHAALGSLAVRDGKVDPGLVRALSDDLPLRRAAAGVALARTAPAERDAVIKLLRDKDATVRLRVALALAAAKEKQAVPVLIESLVDLPGRESEPALDALLLLAGDKTPETTFGDDDATRKKARDAWAAWWKGNGPAVDLAKLDSLRDSTNFRGHTLLIGVSQNRQNGRVMEIGKDGKTRFKIEGLAHPIDAQVIGGNRVLVVEYNGNRITERDLKGNILWQKQLNVQPVQAQRMPNGNTFIASQSEILEIDRDGKEVLRRNFPGQSINSAFKIRTGEIFCLLQQNLVVRLDAKGKEIKRVPTGCSSSGYGGFDVSPDGKVLLIRDFSTRRVVAIDPDGKALFAINVPNITSASWLPNGNVLVCHFETQRVMEMDRNGRTVWEHRENFFHFRARRR